jgi:UPF0042 nucleotide-binding protein
MLIPKFAEVCEQARGRLMRVALGIDVREGGFLNRLLDELEYLKKNKFSYEILFLDARTEVLINRYSETKRKHPLSGRRRSLATAIERDRRTVAKLRRVADHIVDTSDLNIHQLKQRLSMTFGATDESPALAVNVVSFGYRHGVPTGVDMVFDARFLPNPNYVPHLKAKTGNHKKVAEYLLRSPACKEFIAKIEDLLNFLLPQFTKEGKSYLTVAFGCTGGRHRSVVLANVVGNHLVEQGFDTNISHRDIRKK